MQAAAQVTELEVPLQSRVDWLRRNYSYFEDEHKHLLMAKLEAFTKTSGKKVVGKWRALPEQGKWNDFVASMLQEQYDVVYARAQVKYLTPGNSQQEADAEPNGALQTGPAQAEQLEGNSGTHDVHTGQVVGTADRAVGTSDSSDEAEHLQEGTNGVAQAASALSHLFGGPSEKLKQQTSTKQAESTEPWY